ncbi:MAG: hypothetical protein RLZZ599_626 [Bacteroidota bacterium]
MKSTVATIFAVAILGASLFLAHAYKTRGDRPGQVAVTGSGSITFESDKIVWSGTFTTKNADLTTAFAQIKSDREIIEKYLKQRGVSPNEISFRQVRTSEATKAQYSEKGNYIGSEFYAYELRQDVVIESRDLDGITAISREISELLKDGVQITSNFPEYYYSELESLKLNLIEKASENGRIRAEQIAKNSKSSIVGLKNARLGVFQILGYNSGESYSWSGTFNTSSRWKTASITVKMDFEVE